MDINENAPGNKSQQPETRTTDNETGHDPKRDEPEVPLPPHDEAPVDEDMTNVDANNSVSSEYPEVGQSGRVDNPKAAPQMVHQDENDKEARSIACE
ncbi:MatE family transporter [Pseudomonas sp. IT-P4]